MKTTYYGHSCFAVELNGKTILFDPFISGNERAKHIDIALIKPDYILITHGHADHVSDVLRIAQQSGATLVSNFEVISWFAGQGYDKGHPMNHGGRWTFDFGTVQYVNAVHSSSMPDGSYGGNPGGFIITGGEDCIYVSGDTALTMDMKIFGEMNTIDTAFLCIGDNFTMGAVEAVTAAQWLRAGKVFGLHFDTFGYIEIDHAVTQDLFAQKSIPFILPEIGGEYDL